MFTESLPQMVREQGGATVDPATGASPTTGYAVGRSGFSLVVTEDLFWSAGTALVSAWLVSHAARLARPDTYMGLWHDTENGRVVLDVVTVLTDRAAAIALARTEDQVAIFDLGSFAEIATGGSGGYLGATA